MIDDTTDHSEIRDLRSLRVELNDFVQQTEGRLQSLATSLGQYVNDHQQPLSDTSADTGGIQALSTDQHAVIPDPTDPLGRLNAIKQRLAKRIDNHDASC